MRYIKNFNEGIKVNMIYPLKASNDNIHIIVLNEIKRLGRKADLNHIDVSCVTNLDRLFNLDAYNKTEEANAEILNSFNGDISKWDVRNVERFRNMFSLNSSFSGDLDYWNIRSINLNLPYQKYNFGKFNPWWDFFRTYFNNDITLMYDSLDWNWIDIDVKTINISRFIWILKRNKLSTFSANKKYIQNCMGNYKVFDK